MKDCKSSEFINRKEERSYEPSKDTDDNSRNPWLGNLWRHLANGDIGEDNAEGGDDSFADHGHDESNEGPNAKSSGVSKHEIESLLSRWAESS